MYTYVVELTSAYFFSKCACAEGRHAKWQGLCGLNPVIHVDCIINKCLFLLQMCLRWRPPCKMTGTLWI